MLTKLNNIKINNDYRDIIIQEKLILSPNYGKMTLILFCVQLSSSIILIISFKIPKSETSW